MPKSVMKYDNCCIYKIEHINDESLVYVGHTTNFKQRKAQHKSSCNCENNSKFNLKLYQMLRDNGGWEMFKMIEVEKYPCKDKREAERRENEVMKELKASMNTMISFVSEEERKRTHNERNKEYFKKNKDLIKESRKNRYEKSGKIKCECGCEVVKMNLKRHQTSKKHKFLFNNISP